ncbi:HCP-like protein [Trichoderma aethiopicum]
MAYEGGYNGSQQRPYAGSAAHPAMARGYGGPNEYHQDDGYGGGGYGPEYGNNQHQGAGYGQGRPGPARGGRPPQEGGRGGPHMMPPEGQRGANYPPRGGMGPGNRGRPNMPRGGGPGPGPGPGGRQPMNNPRMNPPGPGYADGNYQLADQMSQMDLNGQGHRQPPTRNASQNYAGPRHGQPRQAPGGYGDYADGGYGARPPPNQYGAQRSMTMPNSVAAGRGVPQRPATTTGNRPPPQRTYPQDTQGPPPQRQYSNAGGQGPGSNGYGPGPGPGQHVDNGYGAPSYNEGMDDLYDSYYDEPTANTTHLNPQDSQMLQTHARQESRSSMPDFDAIPVHSKRDSFEQSLRQGNEQPQQGAHQIPKLAHARSMVELREPQAAVFEMTGDIPAVPAIPQTHAYQQQQQQGYGQDAYGQGHSGQGYGHNGYDQGHDDEGYGQSGYDHGYGGPGGYSQPPIPRGPSAPPGPAGQHPGFANNRPPIVRPGTAAPANPDSLPAHPTPVRPGLMENSMVNPNAKPPPIRNYGGGPQVGQQPVQQYQQQQQLQQAPMQQQQQPQQTRYSGQSQHPEQQQQPYPQQAPPPVRPKEKEPPVTPSELEHLRMIIKGNPNDQASALKLAKRLIEASDVLIPNVPDARARSKARERYLADAHKILKKLVHSQNSDAMFIMADGAGRGLFGPEADSKEAFTLYQSAAKLGHAAAAYRTAVCCEIGHEEGGGTRKDPMKAIQWYKRAATLGDPPAMYKVGMILLKGLLGQPKNPREAVGWLKRAAERADAENPHALHELGLLYESAQGNDVIIRDEQYALSLFQQAAEIGYKFSQFRLGCAYEYGLLGCPIDPRLSIVWYSRAAQQEEHQSELALSGWYLTGSEGVLGQSDTEAYLWARKAAVAGLAKAEYAMGYFTEVGIGVPANLEDAKRWYWRAAAQDFPQARERLEDLKRSGKEKARPRERISRSRIEKQDGDCVLM